MDFVPYEGGPLRSGHDLKRWMFALAMAVDLLAGAWVLAVFVPTPNTISLGKASGTASTTTGVCDFAGADGTLLQAA